jgi:hypothetical protein
MIRRQAARHRETDARPDLRVRPSRLGAVGADAAAVARTLAAVRGASGNHAAAAVVAAHLARQPAAAPVTAPDTGLAGDRPVERLAGAARELAQDWDGLATPERRAAVLFRGPQAALRQLGVPPFELELKPPKDLGPLDPFRGEFDIAQWKVNFDVKLFAGPLPKPDVLEKLVESSVHEARHCEQWFRMARYLAGQSPKLEAADIARQMGIWEPAAAQARRRPLAGSGPEAEEARAWYESVYGSGAAERREVLLELPAAAVNVKYRRKLAADARTALRKAGDELHFAPPEQKDEAQERYDEALAEWQKADAELRAAETEYRDLYKRYRQLPTEADAARVGSRVGDALTAP